MTTSQMDRIYARILLDVAHMEEFLQTFEAGKHGSNLITTNVTIHYTLNGEDHYANWDFTDILDFLKFKNQKLEKELINHGVIKEKTK